MLFLSFAVWRAELFCQSGKPTLLQLHALYVTKKNADSAADTGQFSVERPLLHLPSCIPWSFQALPLPEAAAALVTAEIQRYHPLVSLRFLSATKGKWWLARWKRCKKKKKKSLIQSLVGNKSRFARHSEPENYSWREIVFWPWQNNTHRCPMDKNNFLLVN